MKRSALVRQLPECRYCDSSTVAYRQEGNPIYGVEGDAWKPRTQDSFLVWAQGLAEQNELPNEVYGTCAIHLDWENDSEGKPVPPPHVRKATRAQERRQKPRQTRTAVRRQLIAVMGGACHECATTVELRVVSPDGLKDELGILPGPSWWQFLLSDPEVRAKCQLLCGDCFLSQVRAPKVALDPRARVLAAYGGTCVDCGTQQEPLWVVAQPGTPKLLRANGKRPSSVHKIDMLIRAGFPPGYELRCLDHPRGE